MFWNRKQARPEPPRASWEPVGAEVGVEECLVQAAQAIDTAGTLAARSGDSAGLLQAGEYWTRLADFIVALGDREDKKNLDKKSDFPTGFQAKKEDEENA